MKKNVIIWIVAIGLFLSVLSSSFIYLYFKEVATSKRLTYDLKAANEQAEQFKAKDGHQASKIIAQDLTAKELKKVNPAIVAQLNNLYIPPRRTESYTQTEQTTEVEVKATVKDSSIIRPATNKNRFTKEFEAADPLNKDTIKVKVLEYRDKWISIHAIQDPDTAKIKVLAKDTIFTAIYRGDRRHPWAWIFSKRQYQAAATNRSPYVKINVVASGVIKK